MAHQRHAQLLENADLVGLEIVTVGGVSRRCPAVDLISGNALD